MDHSYRLVISCPDRVGIVARVSQFITEHGGWLSEASYHSDREAAWFFMRNEILADSLAISAADFRLGFAELAQQFNMSWYLRDSSQRQRVVLLVSRASHCLADILHRWHSGELDCDIPCVISNHDNLREMVEWHAIPFYHVPVDPADKSVAYGEIERLIEHHGGDVVVLARFMQIIPADLCQRYYGRMLNIHHSFLPSFVGANPYQRAYERGVKLIGASCHYVTEVLDHGPIVEQDVIRVNHRHTTEDMIRLGKDVEQRVLARGLRAHLEDRVMVHGNKTIVFD
jgi:formyltetrahydrofolate deformylase